jgi:aryl-alcohol dehydrogenase-like predicted oxidoreductase
MSLSSNQGFQKVPLGRTGMLISRVGFGAWAVGGGDWSVGWGPQDDAASIAAIRYAVEQGINWIDTAAAYGLGHSEEVVAKALEGLPHSMRPFLFTKCGVVGDLAHRQEMPKRIGRPKSIREEVEQSLRRLQVDQIDLYQMHWPPQDGTPIEEYWQTLLDLKREGKVRAVGLSNHDVDSLRRAECLGHVDTLQPPFSAIQRQSAVSEIPWCATHETGVIVYSPMQSGLLSGRFNAERAASLPPSDWRSRSEEFRGEKLARNLALAEALRPIGRTHQVSAGVVAIAWSLAWPGVTGAIVGARSAEQVRGWLPACSLHLSEAELETVSSAIESTGAGYGLSRAAD